MATFADRIKRLRENKGWSQEQMASALGISSDILCAYEAEEVSPNRSEIEKYAEILHKNADWLAGVPGATKKRTAENSLRLQDGDEELLRDYHLLDSFDRGRVKGYLESILEGGKYL